MVEKGREEVGKRMEKPPTSYEKRGKNMPKKEKFSSLDKGEFSIEVFHRHSLFLRNLWKTMLIMWKTQ